ncbi:TolC family protein [Enterobacter mori]|uniref:TolC family protein n=1 Tax=Enterobacter mori TaxID=539813 RepID=UPI001B8D919A|nr:TolC family protein [Enterobacter mori]MBS3048419.1 TolC family protein [Enterobacter mori]
MKSDSIFMQRRLAALLTAAACLASAKSAANSDGLLAFAPTAPVVKSRMVMASEPPAPAAPLVEQMPAAVKPASRPPRAAGPVPGEGEIRALFNDAVSTALSISPEVRGANFNTEAAQANVDEAKGQRWPQVDVGTRSKSYQFGGGERRYSDSRPAVTVNVATTLLDFGRTSNTIKSREALHDAAQNNVNAQAEDIAWQVSSSLVELSKQHQIISLSQKYVARMNELVEMLDGIVKVDQGRRSELTQARGRLLQAQSSLDTAVSRARDTEITLNRLLGDKTVPLPTATAWDLKPGELATQLAAIDTHPTIRQAQAETASALADADAARSASFPTVTWNVGKSTGRDELGREQSWETGVNVSWPIFRGGSQRAAELSAARRADASREAIEQQSRDLDNRVRAADQDARSMLERAGLYHDLALESDRIRHDFFDQWYHLGRRTLLDVLSAESDYYGNQVAEVTNRFDGYAAIFRSYASSGTLLQWLRDSR